jgi:SRSO17 transposase
MDLMTHDGTTSESRFAAYVEALSATVGRADRKAPLKDYCTGPILPGERKSVESMAVDQHERATPRQSHLRA